MAQSKLARSAEKSRNTSRMALNIHSAVGLVHGWRSLCRLTMDNAYFPDAVPLDEQRRPISVLTRTVGVLLSDNHLIRANFVLMECDQGSRSSWPCSRLRIMQGATPQWRRYLVY